MRKILYLVFSMLVITSTYADTEYKIVNAFVQQQFTEEAPLPSILWLTDDIQTVIKRLIVHPYNKLRLRFWKQSLKTVWILDEVGKESPITIGVVVNQQKIQLLKVLIYRESRGDEVKHDFFTRQFDSATLTAQGKLSAHVDGISGATLSVRALKRMAKMALWLDRQVTDDN